MQWVREPLGDICREGKGRIQTGPFGSQLHESDYSADGTPVVMPADIVDGKVAVTRIDRVTESHVERLKRHKLAKGDIVYGRRGDIGRQALVRDENIGWLCGTVCLKISLGDSPLISEFLHRYLSTKAVVSWIEGQAVGATMPNLNTGILERVPVFYPKDKTTQKKIAAILSAYDELIENNQRRIALLEKMAEEIYREWFVRLRFPGHEKMKKVKGVPEGWEIDRVDSIGKIVTGKTPSTDNPRYFGGPYSFIKTPDMHGNIFIVETEEMLSQNGLDSQPSQTIPRGSICVSCIGTGGIVSITTSECQTNQQINSVVVRNPSDLEWAFFTLRNLREAIQMFGATGATMTNLSKGKFSSLKILRPNKSIVLKYHALVNPIFVQMQSILQQTMILRSTRDLLLPRLISGKLSVEHLDIQFPPGMEESACV